MLDFGINILWFSKENYLKGNNLPDHNHKFFHCFYVLGGTANIKIDGKTFTAHSDELYLAHNCMQHSLEVIDTNGIQVIEIKFIINNSKLTSEIKRLETSIKFKDTQVRHVFESFIDEGTRMESYYNDLINLRFLEILLQLLRSKDKSNNDKYVKYGIRTKNVENICQEKGINEQDMKKVACYIENNLTSKIELDDLARLANMSKYHFCRNFKKVFYISPMRYLNSMRMEKAKELMMCSGLNVSQIACNVGFDDIQYFSRFFKQCEGVSPYEYMHKFKPNLYFFPQKNEYQLRKNLLEVSD